MGDFSLNMEQVDKKLDTKNETKLSVNPLTKKQLNKKAGVSVKEKATMAKGMEQSNLIFNIKREPKVVITPLSKKLVERIMANTIQKIDPKLETNQINKNNKQTDLI